MVPSLTHLHIHSTYTLLGATASVSALVTRAAEERQTHLALTDTNVLYGAVAFQRACQHAGVEPILGMVLTVQLPEMLDPAVPTDQLVLIARGPDGYRSLCRLSSHIQANPERETLAQQGVPWQLLKEESQGLLCIAGGRRSPLEQWLRADAQKWSSSYLSRLAGIFDDQLYLALEIHQPADREIAQAMTTLGERFGVQSVAVQPIYCLEPDERPRLRLLAAIDRNCRLDEVAPETLPDGSDPAVDLHWLSPVEMAERFADFPTALTTTQAIATQCKPALPDGRPIWPTLNLPDDTSPEDALTDQAQTGLHHRYPTHKPTSQLANQPTNHQAISSRLHHELTIINNAGYAPLLLLVAKIVRYAKKQAIPVSTRGSVANSLVAYCIGITTVDPIEHDLLFERFLNPERTNPPDIDLDLCSVRRDEVLNYVRQTYGEERVALVATVSTMQPRSAIGETAKAYGLTEEEAKALVKLVPDRWHPDPRRKVRSALDTMLEKLTDVLQRQIVTAAYEIVGQPHHLSIHPGGLVVTPEPLTDIVPVQWTPKGFTITQFAHSEVEAIGLPKVDLLGIRALTVLAETTKLIQQHYDPTFRLETIPLDDAATAAELKIGDTVGVFQCESTGARRTLRQLKTRTVQDLAVANAFFKPGPATGGMAGNFIRRYREEEAISYLHPALAPILGPTKGVLIFQEQVLRVAYEIAGLSWTEADELRKGMSKFQPQAMQQMRERFVQGCQRSAPDGYAFTAEQAETLWEQVVAFAGYGFNQGHATAYADVSYRSAYLHAHYPAAFLAARLANYGGFHHPAVYIAEARRLGIHVQPPHINQSEYHFTLAFVGNDQAEPLLWMGLGQVRSLRRRSIAAIIAEREQRLFTDLDDLRHRVDLQRKELTHLIQCGALDGLGTSRAALLAAAGEEGQQRFQLAFAFEELAIDEETAAERIEWEQHILGQPVSLHPVAAVAELPRQIGSLQQAANQIGERIQVATTRLPGWTGGKGYFIDDGESYVVAIAQEKLPRPKPWEPILLTGRWVSDDWGGGWFQVEAWEPLIQA